jgi:hypothetical protein
MLETNKAGKKLNPNKYFRMQKPMIKGTKNVAAPKNMLLFLFSTKLDILISRPARNMIYNKPTAAKTLTPSLLLNRPEPLGPIITPASTKPKMDGTLIFFEMYGTNSIIHMMSVKIATGLDSGDMVKGKLINLLA